MADASIQPIYERLNGIANYHPVSAETFGDWAMEAGDIVKVVRGADEYNVPIHSSTLVWRGKQRVSIDAPGTKERDSIAKASAQKYNRGGSAVRGQQYMHQQFESETASLRSDFYISYEQLRVAFENEITSTRSEFQMTAESLRVEFENDISSVRAEMVMTAESLRVEFENEIDSTRSEFQMTAESLRVEFENEIDSTRSEFQMTAESLRVEFENEIDSARSEFEMTAESLRVVFESEISSTRAEIQVQSDRIGLVVTGTGASARIRPAQIVAAINDAGSSVGIDADHVFITGTTTLSGQMTVQDGSLVVRTALIVSGSTNGNVTINNGSVNAKTYQVNSGGSVKWVGGGKGEYYDIGVDVLKNMIKSASVSNNTLTLTPFYVDPITFSKATTLTDAWSDGKITVTASPQGVTLERLLSQGETDWNGNVATVPINSVWGSQGQYSESTGRTVTVDASGRYTAGQNSVTITKGSWSGGIIQFTKSAGTASTKTVQLVSTAASWNGNTATVQIWDGTAADAQHGVNTGKTVTVDASARYTAGETAGKNAVTITKGSWNSGVIQFTKSAGTASTKEVRLVAAAATWSGNTASVVMWDGTAADAQHGVSTGYTVTVDASARYTAGQTDAGVTYNASTHKVSRALSSSTKEYTIEMYTGNQWTNGTRVISARIGSTDINSATIYAPAATLTFDCTDLGDPQYSEGDKNDNSITGKASHGTYSLGTGTQIVHMTQGSWSSGHKAINCRMTNDSGKLLNRIWVTIAKSNITGTRGNRQTSQPSYDTKLADISGSSTGWYVISITCCGLTKTFGLHVT